MPMILEGEKAASTRCLILVRRANLAIVVVV